MADAEGPVQVLYVMGSGHSGSTLLDIMLGAHPEVLSTGELSSTRGSWIANRYCSCGRRVDECPFWSEVRRNWAGRIGADDVEGYFALEGAFERRSRWPLLWWQRWNPSARFKTYATYTRALFQALREVGGKRVIVDSSKNPLRAFALSLMPGVDLHLVHLIRDGRGVMLSLMNKNRRQKEKEKAGVIKAARVRSVWRVAAFWIGVNLMSEWVRRRFGAGRSVRVCYEDLVADTKGALSGIGRLIDVDFAGVADAVSDGGGIEIEHNIGGNRQVRMSGNLRLRPEAGEWKSRLSRKERLLSRALMGPLLRRYGYQK
jgi:hypothetical protein